ncbi:hypothetical protein GCM10022407_08610 [Hymenobacter antarcticus]|uniref:Uncharacterized protein n=2 Tax=Hymenobacter antarcticus TaxID=486270 RepID=A0ABP7PEI2_9BACT
MGSLSQILVGNYFAALATGLFAAGLLLSNIVYLPSPTKVAINSLRNWRNLTAILLVASSIGLFGYDIGRALYQAIHKPTAETTAK